MNQISSENLSDYKDKYYGVGFQFISQPIQFLIKDLVQNINQSGTISLDDYGAKLISKHFVVFLFFFLVILDISSSSSANVLFPDLFIS